MEVYLSKIEIEVPAREFAESCQSAEEYADILCAIAERFSDKLKTDNRILINSIVDEMSINGRNFIQDLYGAVLHWDKKEIQREKQQD